MTGAQQGPQTGALLADRFHVLEVIGRGGMGIVVRALDKLTRTEVAVKHVRPDLAEDPDYADRLLREAALARDVSHPNVCRVHDAYRHGDEVLLSMEYVHGETLRRRLERGPVPQAEAMSIARQVCAGVAAAHEKGVVHRDLKPENVIIDGRGRAVVLDFGVARKHGSPRDTVTGIALGTPRYMSPEQQLGKAVTPASDVFALGLVIEELFGERPPAWLRPIIRRATDRDPRRRYKDAAALGRALARPWLRPSVVSVAAGGGVAALSALVLIIHPGFLLDFVRLLFADRGHPLTVTLREPQKTLLTRQWGGAHFGTVSPDGRLLAYIEESNHVREGLIRPLRDANHPPRRFSAPRQSVTWLAFSPDSRQIVFSTGRHVVDRASEIYLAEATLEEGAAPRLLGPGSTPSFFPDGQQISFSHYNLDTGRWHLARTPARGGELTRIDTEPAARYEFCSTVSPDGQRLAYVAGPGPGGLRVIPVNGGRAVTLDESPAFYERVQWTPDSKRLIYGTDTNRRGLLSIAATGKSAPTVFLPSSQIAHNPSLTADSKYMLYTRAQESYELWRADPNGQNGTTLRVDTPTDIVAWPLFSPDGQSIAAMIGGADPNNYVANAVQLIPRNGGPARQVSALVPRNTYPESFTPDGKALIIGSGLGGDLEIVSINGEPPPPIRFGHSEAHAAISPNGRWLATLRMEGKGGTAAAGIWVRPLLAPPEQAVCWVDDANGRPAWSLDSTLLAVGTSKGLFAFSRGSEQTRRVRVTDPAGTPLKSRMMRFTKEGRLLFVESPHIYEMDPDGQVARPIVSPQHISNIYGFTLSPDGKELVYAIEPVNSDLWLLESPDRLLLAQNTLR